MCMHDKYAKVGVANQKWAWSFKNFCLLCSQVLPQYYLFPGLPALLQAIVFVGGRS